MGFSYRSPGGPSPRSPRLLHLQGNERVSVLCPCGLVWAGCPSPFGPPSGLFCAWGPGTNAPQPPRSTPAAQSSPSPAAWRPRPCVLSSPFAFPSTSTPAVRVPTRPLAIAHAPGSLDGSSVPRALGAAATRAQDGPKNQGEARGHLTQCQPTPQTLRPQALPPHRGLGAPPAASASGSAICSAGSWALVSPSVKWAVSIVKATGRWDKQPYLPLSNSSLPQTGSFSTCLRP